MRKKVDEEVSRKKYALRGLKINFQFRNFLQLPFSLYSFVFELGWFIVPNFLRRARTWSAFGAVGAS